MEGVCPIGGGYLRLRSLEGRVSRSSCWDERIFGVDALWFRVVIMM